MDCSDSDISCCFLKIRVNFEEETSIENYLKLITEYINLAKVEFTEYTAGRHYKSQRKHFHYHLVLNTNIKNIPVQLKNPNYHFKKKYILEKKGLKEFPTYSIKVEAPILGELQPELSTAISRFLRYPLKEGHPIRDYCSFCTETLDGMILTAKEEFKFSQEQKQKTENEEKIKISKWTELRDYLDSLDLSSEYTNETFDPYQIWMAAAKFMRNDTIPPTMKQIDTMTERYIICRANHGTLSIIGNKRTKQFYN